jgi:hypothetical protein
MFDRFTDRARKVMGLARQEAQRFNHQYIGTEHILLGLIQEGGEVAANVLRNLAVDRDKIRIEIEKIVISGPTVVTMGQLPFTPRAKKILELSSEEASTLRHNYIGTEHLLLGCLREDGGVAAQVDNTELCDALEWLDDDSEPDEALELELEDSVHVPLSEWIPPLVGETPAEAARNFWRAAVSKGGIVEIGANGEAVVEPVGALLVLFPDGTWDTVGGCTPSTHERVFWTHVATLFTTVPTWLLTG